MTTAVNDLVADAARQLRDAANSEWATADLVDYLNEGQKEVARTVDGAYTVTDDITLVAGTRQTIPATGIKFRSLIKNSAGRVPREYDLTALNTDVPTWHAATADNVVKGFMRVPGDPRGFYVYPPQTGTPGDVTIHYDALPADASAGGDITIDDEYGPALIDYMTARALDQDSEARDPEKAAGYMKSFYLRLGANKK